MGSRSPIRLLVVIAAVVVAGSCGSTDLQDGEGDDGGEGPGRENWSGTLHDEHRTTEVVSSADGKFKLTVAPDGTVSGKGSATQVTEGGMGRFKIEVTGTREDDEFRLTWTGPGGSLDVVAPIDGLTAVGTWEIDTAGTVYSGTITLQCKNCKGER